MDIKNVVERVIGYKSGNLFVPVSESNPLPTSSTLEVSDIQIGAVELKDGSSDVRGTIGSDGLEVEVKKSALPSGVAIEDKQDNIIDELQTLNSLAPSIYDYIALTYVSAGNGEGEIETVTFKNGGAGGDIVSTLTFAYNADNEISSVTKS